MADTSTISSLAVSPGSWEPSIFRGAREVNFRAKATLRSDSPVVSRALDRLDNTLASDQPLDRDVPRGFYLNILV